MAYCIKCLNNKKRRSKLNEYVELGHFRDPRTRDTYYRLHCPDKDCQAHRSFLLSADAYFRLLEQSARLWEQKKEDVVKDLAQKDKVRARIHYLERLGKFSVTELTDMQKKELERQYKDIEKPIKHKILGEKFVEKEEKKEAEKKEKKERKKRKAIREEKIKGMRIKCPQCNNFSLVEAIDEKTGNIYYRCTTKGCAHARAKPKLVRTGTVSPCPSCGNNTLEQLRDNKTGKTYLRCTTRGCERAKLEIPRLGFHDIKKGQRKRLFGFRSRRAKAKSDVYERRIKELEEQYEKGEITHEELQQKKREVNQEVYGGKRFRRPRSWERGTRRYAPHIMEVFFALALALLGVIVALFTGAILFMFAFGCVAVYLILPDPNVVKPPPGPIMLSPWQLWGRRDKHAGLAFLKSVAKIGAIVLFAFAFKGLGDLFNIVFIAICFIGYYMLAIDYENQAEFIESLLRFMVLGCYLIPFAVFGSIFNSFVLVAIALAFFAIPPMPKESVDIGKALSRGLSGATMWYDSASRWIFLILMLFALVGSGSFFPSLFGSVGWELEGTLKATFIWFWLVSAIAGFFSPPETRPIAGILMLGGATIIYGVGPGSQEIGSALLGDWWPTVNEGIQEITAPIADVFAQLSATFGTAFQLLVNPVGYATQLLNGSYSTNPYGTTGAFGVELEDLEVSPIFVGQPYLVTTKIKNVGSHTATDVKINVQVGLEQGLDSSGGPRVKELPAHFPKFDWNLRQYIIEAVTRPTLFLTKFGFGDGCKEEDLPHMCSRDIAPTMTPQDVQQVVFTSRGIDAETVSNEKLRKKSIPIFTMLSYNYEADSSVSIEFISQEEWRRLAKEDALVLRKEIPVISTSPIQFPIGTLEQPILTAKPGVEGALLGTPFYIGLKLESNEGKQSRIEQIYNITLTFPKLFGVPTCVPAIKSPLGEEADNYIITWTQETPQLTTFGTQIIVCNFEALDEVHLEGAPSKTFFVEANTHYQFNRWRSWITKIEFGGWCVDKGDCMSGQECRGGVCVPEGTPSGDGTSTPVSKGDLNYCQQKFAGTIPGVNQDRCDLGEGGCNSDNECKQNIMYNADQLGGDTTAEPLECMGITGRSACCPGDAQQQQCQAAFDAWMQGKSLDEVATAMVQAYTNTSS